jgi:cytochrome c-type biogenesis protein CcmH
MRSVLPLAVALLALLLAAPASASERHPTLAEVEHEVMCPTCKTLLELSHAPIAERMRVFIRGRIAAGDTRIEIEDELVDEFGPGVLAAPPRRGFGLLAWLLPLAGLLGAGAVTALVARRWVRAREDEPPVAARSGDDRIDPALERRLDRELARYDG